MKTYLCSLVVFVVMVALLTGLQKSSDAAVKAETTYERVQRTGVLRCAYAIWPPYIDKDIKTGELKGMYVDIAKSAAASLGLKIEFTAEVFLGVQKAALETGKADAVCLDAPWTSQMSRQLAYTEAAYMDPAAVYARADATLGANTRLNTKSVAFIGMDGDISSDLVVKNFTEATLKMLPSSASPGQMIEEVLVGHADAVVLNRIVGDAYIRQNPGKLKRIAVDGKETLAVYPGAFSVLPEETLLRSMLSQAVRDMRNNGQAEKVLQPYRERYPDAILMPKD